MISGPYRGYLAVVVAGNPENLPRVFHIGAVKFVAIKPFFPMAVDHIAQMEKKGGIGRVVADPKVGAHRFCDIVLVGGIARRAAGIPDRMKANGPGLLDRLGAASADDIGQVHDRCVARSRNRTQMPRRKVSRSLRTRLGRYGAIFRWHRREERVCVPQWLRVRTSPTDDLFRHGSTLPSDCTNSGRRCTGPALLRAAGPGCTPRLEEPPNLSLSAKHRRPTNTSARFGPTHPDRRDEAGQCTCAPRKACR